MALTFAWFVVAGWGILMLWGLKQAFMAHEGWQTIWGCIAVVALIFSLLVISGPN